MVILYLLLFCTSYYTYSDRILTRLVESCFVANKNCAKDKFPFSFEPYNINIHQKFMQQQDQDNLRWERKWKMNFHVIPHTHHHKEKANQPLLTTHSRPRPFKEWGGAKWFSVKLLNDLHWCTHVQATAARQIRSVLSVCWQCLICRS